MAHSGRLYPVHFRRDLNINTRTNTRYWPRAWNFSCPNCIGSVGLRLATDTSLQLIAVDESTFTYMTWNGFSKTIAARQISVNLSITPGVEKLFHWRHDLIDNTAGILGTLEFDFDDLDSYNQVQGTWQGAANPRPDLFQTAGAASRWDFLAMHWAQYNDLP